MPDQNSTQGPQNAPPGQGSCGPVDDQNQSDPNQNVPVIPSGFSPAADLPPIPPAFQNVDTNPAGDSGSAAPPATPPIISTPKKKFGSGRIIATILGFFLLVGGIAGGVILTQQQQDIRERAKETNCDQNEIECWDGSCAKSSSKCPKKPAAAPAQTNGGNNSGGSSSSSGSSGAAPAPATTKPSTSPSAGSFGYVYPDGTVAGTYSCGNNQLCLVDSPGTLQAAAQYFQNNPSSPLLSQFTSANQNNINQTITSSSLPNTCSGTGSCGSGGVTGTCVNGVCVTSDTSCKTGDPNAPGCCINTTSCDGQVVCEGGQLGGRKECKMANGQHCTMAVGAASGCGGSGTGNQITTTTTPTASCQNIKAYNSTWTLMTSAQLSALTTGSQINFCVSGTASSGAFDKARFTINSVAQAETMTKRPSSEDYCQLYTIPAGTTTFTINAQIHHATLGWK